MKILSANFIALFTLIVLSIVGLQGLSNEGFYTSHDGETHTARIAQYYDALKDGQYPPRIAQSFYNYLGSPIFVYIYPLPYALGAVIHLFGFSYVNTFKILMSLGFIFSSIFSYLWLKEVFRSEKAGFLGALFYTWVPYRFLLIYVRASLSELIAYCFVPLVFYLLTKLTKEQNSKWVGLGALSVASLLLSQNLVALITIPVMGVYVLTTAIGKKSVKYLISCALTFALGLAISAITYLPSLFELRFVRFEQTINGAYANHFVTIGQLIRSPWGYGFDLPGIVNDQLSFEIGPAHILVMLLAIILFGVYLARNVSFIKRLTNKIYVQSEGILYIQAVFFLLVLTGSIFLMVQSKYSTYIWQNIKSLQTIDIPWRFLGVTALSSSFIAAFVAKSIKPGLVFVFLVLLVIFSNHNHSRINQARNLDDKFFDTYAGTATQYNEFTPKWRQTEKVPEFDPGKRVEVIGDGATISNIQSNSKKTTFEAYVSSDSSQIVINKFYFPDVELKVDNQESKDFTITNSAIPKDVSGLVETSLKKGNHLVEFTYKETKLRQAADYITLFSIFVALFLIYKNVKV